MYNYEIELDICAEEDALITDEDIYKIIDSSMKDDRDFENNVVFNNKLRPKATSYTK